MPITNTEKDIDIDPKGILLLLEAVEKKQKDSKSLLEKNNVESLSQQIKKKNNGEISKKSYVIEKNPLIKEKIEKNNFEKNKKDTELNFNNFQNYTLESQKSTLLSYICINENQKINKDKESLKRKQNFDNASIDIFQPKIQKITYTQQTPTTSNDKKEPIIIDLTTTQTNNELQQQYKDCTTSEQKVIIDLTTTQTNNESQQKITNSCLKDSKTKNQFCKTFDDIFNHTRDYFSSEGKKIMTCLKRLKGYYSFITPDSPSYYIKKILNIYLDDLEKNNYSFQKKSFGGPEYSIIGYEHFQIEFALEIIQFINTYLQNIAINKQIISHKNPKTYLPGKIFILLPAPYYYARNSNNVLCVFVLPTKDRSKEHFIIKPYASALKTIGDSMLVDSKYNGLIVGTAEQAQIDEKNAYIFIPPMFNKDFSFINGVVDKELHVRIYFYINKHNYTQELGFGCNLFELFEDVIIPSHYKKITKKQIDECKKHTGTQNICYKFFSEIKKFGQKAITLTKSTLFKRMCEKAAIINNAEKDKNS